MLAKILPALKNHTNSDSWMPLFRWARSCNHLSRLGIPTEMEEEEEEEVQEYLSGSVDLSGDFNDVLF